jgi:hypothetical protein
LFFIVALIQPKYGHVVSARGRFSPSSAALLTAFIAKTVELSFVMVFLAFIGQVKTLMYELHVRHTLTSYMDILGAVKESYPTERH